MPKGLMQKNRNAFSQRRQHLQPIVRPTFVYASGTQLNRRWIIAGVVAGIVLAAAATLLVLRSHHWRPGTVTIQGAVIRADSDTRKQLPISDAVVTASDGTTSASA